jgi:F-type H+-transporting ATPase subunit epsilon
MTTFTLRLRDATHSEVFERVTSFVAEDDSGSFGIRAHHARIMAAPVFGLARFRIGEEPWQYLAMPGALLYFLNNELTINTRRYLIDDNYEHISRVLQEQLLSEEQNLKSMKDSLHRMEEEVLKRLWELDRGSI